jgi:hypothetical protein
MINNRSTLSVIILSCLVLLISAVYPKEFEFMGIKLGMTEQDVTNIVSQSQLLQIDESRYFGKINDATPFIMKASYFPYIQNLYVQFFSNTAYGITIQFNPGYFDFYSISDTLEKKYSAPSLKTSRLVLWDRFQTNSNPAFKDIRMRLEYPTTVKVFDYQIMKQVNTELSQNIVRITNESMIASNRRALMDEL